MAQKVSHLTVGSSWIPQATFTVGGVNTDPTNLIVRQQDAAGVETVLYNGLVSALNAGTTPIAKTATGVFKANPGIDLTASGYWFVKFEGTGAAKATIQDEVIVDPDEFTSNAGLSTRALVSLPETKDWLQQQNLNVTSDLELVRVINDISDRMHYEAAREFKSMGTNPAVRFFDVAYMTKWDPIYIDGQWLGDRNPLGRTVRIGDLASAPTLVRILDRDWSTVLETVSAGNISSLPLIREPWEPIRELQFASTVTSLYTGLRVEVTGTWGFPAVPGNVRQAVLDAVAMVMDRDVEHYRQDLGPQPGEGGNVIMLGGSQRILSLPPSAQAVAWAYRDNWLG